MSDKPVPPIPLSLLQDLEERFKDACPEPSWPEREVWMAVGAVRVVRFLRQAWKDQNENILEAKVM